MWRNQENSIHLSLSRLNANMPAKHLHYKFFIVIGSKWPRYFEDFKQHGKRENWGNKNCQHWANKNPEQHTVRYTKSILRQNWNNREEHQIRKHSHQVHNLLSKAEGRMLEHYVCPERLEFICSEEIHIPPTTFGTACKTRYVKNSIMMKNWFCIIWQGEIKYAVVPDGRVRSNVTGTNYIDRIDFDIVPAARWQGKIYPLESSFPEYSGNSAGLHSLSQIWKHSKIWQVYFITKPMQFWLSSQKKRNSYFHRNHP